MPGRPHVLILMPDQLRADHLSCSGHPTVKTPNMDRLAAEGTRFETAYTTSPLCMPARSTFLANQFAHNHGQWDNNGRLSAEVDTYAKRLRSAGYHTCHVGKSHFYQHGHGEHLRRNEPFLNALGWDDVYEVTGPHTTERANSVCTDRWEKLGILKTFRDDYAKRAENPVRNLWPSPMPLGETLDDFVGRTATEYVESYDSEEPLLLFVGFPGPHEPLDPPADWAAKYENAPTPEPEPVTEPPAWVPAHAAELQRKLQRANPEVTPDVVAKTRRLYYGKISHIDSWIGRILDAFDRKGMLDETAIVLWSDHGDMLWDKGRVHKEVFFDQATRIPIIIRAPESAMKPSGNVACGLTSLVDIFPTILDLAGVDAKAGAYGKSLVPALDNPGMPINDAVFSEVHFQTMVRDGRHKLVVNRRGESLMLYDLVDDPRERVNLLGKTGTEEIVRRLRDRMLCWFLDTPNEQK